MFDDPLVWAKPLSAYDFTLILRFHVACYKKDTIGVSARECSSASYLVHDYTQKIFHGLYPESEAREFNSNLQIGARVMRSKQHYDVTSRLALSDLCPYTFWDKQAVRYVSTFFDRLPDKSVGSSIQRGMFVLNKH